MRRLFAGLATAALCACSSKELVVESDTEWQGTIDQFGTVKGRGNARYDISDGDGEICWTFQKKTSLGTLRVYADDGTWFDLGSEIDGEQTTTAPDGQVTGCAL